MSYATIDARPLEDNEVTGWHSLFHWHCGRPMLRVISYWGPSKNTLGYYVKRPRRGCESWICEFCGHRKLPPKGGSGIGEG
jgi:hypothetical protein